MLSGHSLCFRGGRLSLICALVLPVWMKLTVAILPLLAVPELSAQTSEPPLPSVIENTPARLQLEFRIPAPQLSQEEIDGEVYAIPRIAGFELMHRQGMPALPAASYLIVLPPVGEPLLRVTTSPGPRFGGKRLLPSLVARVLPDADSLYYALAPLRRPSLVNLEPAAIVETAWWRGYRLGRLQILPLQVTPGADGSNLQFYSSITVAIEFPEVATIGAVPPSVEEKQVLRHALNFQHAARLARPPAFSSGVGAADRDQHLVPPPALGERTANEWTMPADSNAFKIVVAADGLYALSYEYLASAGVPVDQWQARQGGVHLWHRGAEVPLHFVGDEDSLFEAGERFVFFGQRRRGDDAYYNDYSDETVYWLSADGTSGLRMGERRVADGAGATVNNYFFERRHFEEDDLYYHGDNDAQIYTTLQIPGEGWVWRKLFGGEQFQTGLLLQNPASNGLGPASIMGEGSGLRPASLTGEGGGAGAGTAPACSVAVRVRGITVDPVKPNHHVEFLLNGSLIGEAVFSDNQEVIFRGEFLSSLVRVGSNTFVLRSVGDTGAAIDQIYFDWVEIGYWRSYVASDNFLRFHAGQNTSSRGPGSRYVIFNLHNANVELYDRANQQALTGFTVNQYTPTQWQVSFVDTAASVDGQGGEYLALTREALKTPLAISRNAPSSWRRATNSPEALIGADYLIVTHRDFRAAAERLASHRRRAGNQRFRVIVADIEDIYDEFNFGMSDPEALRAFFRETYSNWTAPAPRYALLVGDASWDPKSNAPGSRKQNFILPFGNPVSDNRYVCFDGPDDFIPDMFIGRLPVETPEQAEAVVDKITAYEKSALQFWHKDFVFLNGGIDIYEQQIFLRQSEGLIGRHVMPGPVGGRPVRIYKTTPGRLVGELRPQIMSAIDNGAVMFTFLGHAGSQTWELMLINEDLTDLRNDGRLPFIASMTCHTARYGDPQQDCFGEIFLRLPDRGAAAFWGTAGWGFIFQDGILLDKMYAAMAEDSVRAIGVLTTLAKIGLWQQWGSGIANVNTIDQYSLLGDPALELALPLAPDLTIEPAGISFAPSNPSEQTPQVNVQVAVRNYGLASSDSVLLSVRAGLASQSELSEALFAGKLPPIGFSDSLRVNWPSYGHRGEYRVRASADAEQRIAEIDENNNEAERPIYFFTNSISIAKPAPLAQLNQLQPTLAVHNPAVASAAARTYFFEVDTAKGQAPPDFTSSSRLVSPAIPEGVLQTAWQVHRPLRDGLYFWRSRSSENGVASPWQISSYRIAIDKENGFAQSGIAQLANGVFAQAHLDSVAAAVTLAPDVSRALPLEVQSAGYEDGSRCYLIANFAVVNAGIHLRGHHIVALSPVTQAIIAGPRYFDTYASAAAADSLGAFIEALPLRTLVLAGIRDEGSVNMTERAYRALESLGSSKARQVGFRDSWAMIAQKGLAIGLAVEEHRTRGAGAATVGLTFQPFYRNGKFHSLPIGPASDWKELRWQGNAGANGTTLAVDVYGCSQDESDWNLLQSDVARAQPLSFIDVKRFPFVQLTARVSDDDGLDSPEFLGWELDYTGGADLAIGATTMRASPDSVLEGEGVTVTAGVYNFGAAGAEAPVAFSFDHPDSGLQCFASPLVAVPAGGFSEISAVWQRPGVRGQVDLFVEVDPGNQVAEPYELNNLATRQVYVIADSAAPQLHLTFDGKDLIAGDFVASRPLIVCDVFDDGASPISDTSQVSILLDGTRISHQSAGDGLRIESQNTDLPSGGAPFDGTPFSSRLKARIHYQPLLSGGSHTLEFFVHDASRNTGYARAEFFVQTDFRLYNVMNYPNPFARETEFTYYLTQPAEQVSVKIFTLSGRLICAFDNGPTAAGFNRLLWNGRDADGDELANGVYLYKISARRARRTEEIIQKCVVMQ